MRDSILYPVYKPSIHGNEIKYVNDCLESSWISSKGKYIIQFEEAFADFLGVKYATCVSNGTVALHLALLALDIGPGDEVIVPTLTYIASVNAIHYTGAIPVFTDSLQNTWQMDPVSIREKITKRTRAIMVVHVYGHPCEMNEITRIAAENDLQIIEDCSEAIGTKFRDQYVGTFGAISTFSFFGNKTITTGEGGMVVSDNPGIMDLVRRLKGQGLAKDQEYWHDIIGYNYRMTNICAAIGLAQLERIHELIEKKKLIAQWYNQGLTGTGIISNYTNDRNITHSYWMFSILADNSSEKTRLRNHLKNHGIETRPLFHPVHLMPIYNSEKLTFPVAEWLGECGINLPSYPDLGQKDIEFIVSCIKHLEE